jgi:hypothetical protein
MAALTWAHNVQSQDPRGAAARYRRLADGNDRVAARALFDLGYVQLLHLHDPRAAGVAAAEYEQRFPTGADLADVVWLRMEAALALQQDDAARAAGATYLERWPSGQKADHVRITLQKLTP